jgi:hypothetical protein
MNPLCYLISKAIHFPFGVGQPGYLAVLSTSARKFSYRLL